MQDWNKIFDYCVRKNKEGDVEWVFKNPRCTVVFTKDYYYANDSASLELIQKHSGLPLETVLEITADMKKREYDPLKSFIVGISDRANLSAGD